MSRFLSGKILRRALLACLLTGLGAVGALLTSPWWIGPLAQSIAPHFGAHIGKTAINDYSTLSWEGIDYKSGTLDAEMEKITLPSLPAWLAWKLFDTGHAEISVNGVLAEVRTSEDDQDAVMTEPALGEILNTAHKYNQMARSYVDELSVDAVNIQMDDKKLLLQDVFWDSKRVSLVAEAYDETVDVNLEMSAGPKFAFYIQNAKHSLAVKGNILINEEDQAQLIANATHSGSGIEISSTWPDEGLVPGNARLQTKDFAVPTHYLGEDYDDLQAELDLDAIWQADRYSLEATLSVEAAKGEELPPTALEMSAHGDLRQLTINALLADTEWLKAELYNPITIEFENIAAMPDANFSLVADFDRQNLIPLKGQLQAAVIADHRDDTWSLLTATWSAQDLSYDQQPALDITGKTQLDWPEVNISEVIASSVDGSEIRLQASASLEDNKLLHADIKGTVMIALAESFGLTGVDFESLSFEARAEGPFEQIKHSGSAQLKAAQVGTDYFNGTLQWSGRMLDFESVHIDGDGERAGFTLETSLALKDSGLNASVKQLDIRVKDIADLTLQQPFELEITSDTRVQLGTVQLSSSAGGHLSATGTLNWPDTGRMTVSAKAVNSVWAGLFIDSPPPFPIEIEQFNMEASWDNGPAIFSLDSSIIADPEGQDICRIVTKISSDGQLTYIDKIEITQADVNITSASGTLPVSLHPAGPDILKIDPDAPVHFEATARPDAAPLWNSLETGIGIDFLDPRLMAKLDGSLSEPNGSIDIGFDALTPLEDSEALPAIENGRARMRFTPGLAALETLSVSIDTHPITAQAQMPMSSESWRAFFKEQTLPDIHKLTGNFDMSNLPLAVARKYLPDVLRDRGTVTIQGKMAEGLDYSGTLQLKGIETRPVSPLGAITQIQADMALSGPTVTIKEASAMIGGRSISLTGDVGIADWQQPRWNLQINGKAVPFVRSPGLIVRGSPDMTIITDDEGRTTVGGEVTLNESFFTLDLAAIGAGDSSGAAAPTRFPYFSIQDEPLAKWFLDLTVHGEDFLRIRTPVFEGIATAEFELRGTLLEPFAFGQASIDPGVVLFPFATFRTSEGRITVSEDDPYNPQLNITASGRAYGYDITMRLTGTPDDPQLTFSSTPSLEQGEILLMVTAGQIPREDRSSSSRLAGLGIFIGNTVLVDLGLVDPLDDRLQVMIGEDITETGRDTIKVVYRINETWAVVGQYDRFDAYTLDFKYTIYED